MVRSKPVLLVGAPATVCELVLVAEPEPHSQAIPKKADITGKHMRIVLF